MGSTFSRILAVGAIAVVIMYLRKKDGGSIEGPNAGMIRELRKLRTELMRFIDTENCHPIMVRLAWHDSGTYDRRIAAFPQRGGANGAIIHDPELYMGANKGLTKAVTFLKEYKAKHPSVSWADLIQMASAVAVEVAGGPKIPMKYGRVDVSGPGDCAPPTSREGFAGNAGLPDPKPGADGKFPCGATDAATHLRNVFTKKMGFTDQEIVALSGAHTIGRAFKERSGTCPFGSIQAGHQPCKYTREGCVVRHDGKSGVGMEGGQSWTKNWLKFDNEYFKVYTEQDPELLWFPTDSALHTDQGFQATFQLYKSDQAAFFRDYAQAHKKLSELGSQFSPAEGVTL